MDNWVQILEKRNSSPEAKALDTRRNPVIYRVNPALKEFRRELYDATYVSLGLFHERTESSFNLLGDSFKLDVVNTFLTETEHGPQEWGNVSATVVKNLKGMEILYDRHSLLDLQPSSIQSILAIDAIFLTFLLLACFGKHLYEQNDHIFSRFRKTTRLFLGPFSSYTWLWCEDAIKLENQIPFDLVKNVIVMIIQHCTSRDLDSCLNQANEILKTLCCDSLNTFCISLPINPPVTILVEDSHHILHIVGEAFWNKFETCTNPDTMLETTTIPSFAGSCYKSLKSKLESLYSSRPTARNGNHQPVTSRGFPNLQLQAASELHKHGIEFQGREESHPKFKTYAFRPWKGTLYLPKIRGIYDGTELLWRNLLEFESRYRRATKDKLFLSYLVFMDNLINTEKDVSVLCTGRNPVIEYNGIGDDKAVADLFNSMTKHHMMPPSSVWSSVEEQLNEYVSARYRTWWSALREAFSHTPWLPISVIAASILLVLTFLQATYQITSFYHHHG